jgi:predicted NUDIX family NTP pyrophosphohydrolase
MYRFVERELQVLLVHPGGPLWKKKDKGAWFVPKGEINPDEEDLAAAQREFTEETGLTPAPRFLPLGEITQKSGKKVVAWAFKGDCDPGSICSNTFEMEWPPRSGKKTVFPEVDRAAFYNTTAARDKMIPAEYEFVIRLERVLSDSANNNSTHLASEKLTGTKSQ